MHPKATVAQQPQPGQQAPPPTPQWVTFSFLPFFFWGGGGKLDAAAALRSGNFYFIFFLARSLK